MFVDPACNPSSPGSVWNAVFHLLEYFRKNCFQASFILLLLQGQSNMAVSIGS